MNKNFDFEKFSRNAIEKLKQDKPLTDSEGVFPLLKMILEASLESEVTGHVRETKPLKNWRNGRVKKIMKSDLGSFELETPRDRNGTFEPQIAPKRQVTISSDIDKNLDSMI